MPHILGENLVLFRMMRLNLLPITLLTASLTMTASANGAEGEVRLVVEQVDNHGLLQSSTYRIYAWLPSSQHSLHAVFADGENLLEVTSTNGFYQNAFGGATSIDINPKLEKIEPELAYDSWLTIGAENSRDNQLWNIGIDFKEFNAGGALQVMDGAWFVTPTDIMSMANANQLVLLMQLTTSGVATGSLNLQGWTPNGETWREYNVHFSTTDARIFGCTNPASANFSERADFDDGSCNSLQGSARSPFLLSSTDWNVFPNPVFESHFNIQFEQRVNLNGEEIRLEVMDRSGNSVLSKLLRSDDLIGGNRFQILHHQPPGFYELILACNNETASQLLLIKDNDDRSLPERIEPMNEAPTEYVTSKAAADLETDPAPSGEEIIFRSGRASNDVSTVAILGLPGSHCDGSPDDGQMTASIVEGELLGLYEVVDRNHLELTLREQQLAMSGLVMEESALAKAGCLAGAQGTILVKSGCLQSKETMQVKLIDCSTSTLHWMATGMNASVFEVMTEVRTQLH